MNSGRVRDLLKVLAGVLLAAALLGWVVRGTDLGAVWAQLRSAPLGLLALALGLNIGHNAFRVWRWRALLDPVRPALPFRPMFVAIVVGYTISWVIPGRLGESLAAFADLARLCRVLVTIRTDVPPDLLPARLEDLAPRRAPTRSATHLWSAGDAASGAARSIQAVAAFQPTRN